jgi:hypothetical protein
MAEMRPVADVGRSWRRREGDGAFTGRERLRGSTA